MIELMKNNPLKAPKLKRIFWLTLGVLFVFSSLSGQGLAQQISDCDKAHIYKDTVWYDPCSISSSCSTNLVGSDNEEKIWNYYRGQGLSATATAGLMGNMQTETAGTWDPRINNGGELTDFPISNKIAYGLVQWLGGRQDKLVNRANANGSIAGDLGLQLDFTMEELRGSYKNTTFDPIQKLQDDRSNVPKAAEVVFIYYEAPGDSSLPARQQNALDIYDKFSGQGGSGGGCGSSTTCNGAEGPNAAILCEAEKYEGIYYLFGGGHVSYDSFRQACPYDYLPKAAEESTVGNPGPCATDCSSLVSISVDGAYNQKFASWTVSGAGKMEGPGTEYWKPVPIEQAQAGDIVTVVGGEGHVEIVDHVEGSTIFVFGSHHTGTRTGPRSDPISYYSGGSYRWTGPGGGTQ